MTTMKLSNLSNQTLAENQAPLPEGAFDFIKSLKLTSLNLLSYSFIILQFNYVELGLMCNQTHSYKNFQLVSFYKIFFVHFILIQLAENNG